jgi:hypothetical protein
MITISRNPNFKEWFDIKLFGVVVNNAKRASQALVLAGNLQEEQKKNSGRRIPITSR